MPKDLFKRNGGEGPQKELTHEDFSSHLLKDIADKEGTKIVAKPIDIMRIVPDVTQPRRAIPFSVRSTYENTPINVPMMLEDWHIKAEHIYGKTINIRDVIEYGGEGLDVDEQSPTILRDYIDLIGLAASIHREGLTNAITVSYMGDLKRIETGERRYLAHHLLTMYVDKVKYAKIAAQEVTRDVWRQASENGARKPLNAIGLARQIAVLIMDMYEGDRDVNFDSFEFLVHPGECDLKFYSQVKNGNLYPVKRGMSQKILDVTGLKNRSQISRYRSLLSLPHDLWITADENNWTEGRIRTVIDEINGTNQSGQFTEETDDVLPIGNITPQNEPYQWPASSTLPPIETTRPHREIGSQSHTESRRERAERPITFDPDLSDGYYDEEKVNPPARNNGSSQLLTEHPNEQLLSQLRTKYRSTALLIHKFAEIYHGQTIDINGEDYTVDGKSIMKLIDAYLNESLTDFARTVQRDGTEYLEEEAQLIVNTADHMMYGAAQHLRTFFEEVISIAYSHIGE